MRWWEAPTQVFPYSFDEVAAVFWDRYPNSFAKHVVSEDVLERKITENTIRTKKLIVKQGSSILKRVPRWMSKMTEIRIVPIIEESIYDRRTKVLTTYTRNVAHCNFFTMHEKCVYKPTQDSLQFPMTDVLRSMFVSIDGGRMASVYEQCVMFGFKKSINNTVKGFNEKLEERFGVRHLMQGTTAAQKEKLNKIKQKLKSSLVNEVKCEEN